MARADAPYLRHMLDAAVRIAAYLDGVGWEPFEQNLEKQDAVIRQLEILGEAASQVSDDLRASQAAIPWPQIIGMRNRLIHGYLAVDIEVVWKTARNRVPEIARQLRHLLEDLGEAAPQ